MLWLLNHRTLMPYEASLIRRLGFEIFVPKIIPKSNFRSGAIDFSYDSSLTLPQSVLARLNRFNFYEDVWTSDITAIVNRYFGTAFIIPHARQVSEAVDKFEGQIVFRAFGLDNSQTYKKVLDILYGPLLLLKIKGIKQRFWFGEGYDNLHECEDPVFAERSLFLPIGLPERFFSTAGQWAVSENKILFVCPFVASDHYYAEIYRRFKRDFGQFPHVIVGAQNVPVDDPHVLGFVSDDELKRLYLNCAVLYYPSMEQRHVHYSPIEAAINGMPVVFFENSLLGRLNKGSMKGCVSSIAEAQQIIERILEHDHQLIAEIRADQRRIAFHFSDQYCSEVWKKEMQERGFIKALEDRPRFAVIRHEVKRALLTPLAQGRTSIDPHVQAIKPPKATLTASQAKEVFGSSLYDGIGFGNASLPDMVDYISGISDAEGWGRWSNGDKVVIVLKHNLCGEFQLLLRAIGYRRNARARIAVRFGDQVRKVRLPAAIEEATGVSLRFNLGMPSNVIEFTVPHPTWPGAGTRKIGIGLIELRAAPKDAPITAPRSDLSAAQFEEAYGSSLLTDGIDFDAAKFPDFVESVQGLSVQEPWGRWSDARRIFINLRHTMQGPFKLRVRAMAYGPNVLARIKVRIGDQTRTMRLPRKLSGDSDRTLHFDLRYPSDVIQFSVPFPMRPPNDGRKIGIGFSRLWIEDAEAETVAKQGGEVATA